MQMNQKSHSNRLILNYQMKYFVLKHQKYRKCLMNLRMLSYLQNLMKQINQMNLSYH